MSPPEKTIYVHHYISEQKMAQCLGRQIMSRRYDPYDDRTQLQRYIDRYPLSFKRTQLAAPIPRPLTLSEITGPAGAELVPSGPLNLSRAAADGLRAGGQLLKISG